MFRNEPLEDHGDDGRGLGVLDEAARRLRVLAVAVGRATGSEPALASGLASAARAPFDEARPLIFRDHALHLQQELAFRRVLARCRQKLDADAGPLELLDQQKLM